MKRTIEVSDLDTKRIRHLKELCVTLGWYEEAIQLRALQKKLEAAAPKKDGLRYWTTTP